MKYLQPSFTIEKPAQITCCEGCVYGAEEHAQFCEVCRPLCWICKRDGRLAEPHLHVLTTIQCGGEKLVIPIDPPDGPTFEQCEANFQRRHGGGRSLVGLTIPDRSFLGV